jgi:hypothetical protein
MAPKSKAGGVNRGGQGKAKAKAKGKAKAKAKAVLRRPAAKGTGKGKGGGNTLTAVYGEGRGHGQYPRRRGRAADSSKGTSKGKDTGIAVEVWGEGGNPFEVQLPSGASWADLQTAVQNMWGPPTYVSLWLLRGVLVDGAVIEAIDCEED